MDRRNERELPRLNDVPYIAHQHVLVHSIPPGGKPPKDADVTVPHPNKMLREQGWRQSWIFRATLTTLAIILLLPTCRFFAELIWLMGKAYYG